MITEIQNDYTGDPVVSCFEAIYTSGSCERRKRLLVDYLGSNDLQRNWVIRMLLGSCELQKIRINRLKIHLLKRIEPWLFEEVKDSMGDQSDVVARMWPGKAENPGDFNWETLQLQLSELHKDELESVFAAFLDEMNESQRWFACQVFLKQNRWHLTRQEVFHCIELSCGLFRGDVESRWYHFNQNNEDFITLLNGRFPLESVEAGAWFKEIEPIVELDFQSITSFQSEDYWAVEVPPSEMLYVYVTERDRAIFSHTGELLNAQFYHLLDVIDQPLQCLGYMMDIESKSRNETGVSRFDPDRHKLCVLSVVTGSLKADHPNIEYLTRKTIGTWEAVESASIIFVKKNQSNDSNPSFLKLLPRVQRCDLVVLYGELLPQTMQFRTLTFGLQNTEKKWIPIVKINYSEIPLIDQIQFEEWYSTHLNFKRGPICEFEKSLVFSITYRGVCSAPRRKSGFNLEYPACCNICWNQTIESLVPFEAFRGSLPG